MKIFLVSILVFFAFDSLAEGENISIDNLVIKEIQKVEISKPKYKIKQLRKSGDSFYKNKRVNSDEYIRFEKTPIQLISNVETLADEYSARGIYFLGSIPINRVTYYKDEASNKNILHLTQSIKKFKLEGDWKHMKVGSEIGYTLIVDLVGEENNSFEADYSVSCVVKQKLRANKLNKLLKGMTKKLECIDTEDQEIVSTLFYLIDYGHMFRTMFKNDFYSTVDKILEIEYYQIQSENEAIAQDQSNSFSHELIGFWENPYYFNWWVIYKDKAINYGGHPEENICRKSEFRPIRKNTIVTSTTEDDGGSMTRDEAFLKLDGDKLMFIGLSTNREAEHIRVPKEHICFSIEKYIKGAPFPMEGVAYY